MQKQFIFKVISCILAIFLLISCFPMLILAQSPDVETAEETPDIQGEDQADRTFTSLEDMIIPSRRDKDVYILAEDVTKRGEFEKHYLCSDGTFVAVTYPEAVHYMDNEGEWADIDNSLSLNAEGSAYEAQNGDFKVSFYNAAGERETTAQMQTAAVLVPSQNESPKNLITLNKGEYELSWTLTANKATVTDDANVSIMSQQASVLSASDQINITVHGEIKDDTQTTATYAKKSISDKDAFTLSKVSNQVSYNSVFGVDEGISARYTTYLNKVKEDIIIYKETDVESFSMSVNCGQLIPVLNSNGSVDFVDKNGDVVYHVGVPYMIDAAYAVSYDVEVALVKSGNTCTITYTPDAEWMESSDREYPIILDPTISTAEYASNVKDTYIEQNSTVDHSEDQLLYINSETNGRRVALISVENLPFVHSSMPIYAADLEMNLLSAQLQDTIVNLYTFSTNKELEQISYSDYSTSNKSLLSSTIMLSGQVLFSFNITADIRDIYEEQDSLILAVELEETNNSYCYPIFSADNPLGEGPCFVISYGYKLPTGLSDGDVISLQSVYNSEYITLGDSDAGEGSDVLTETTSTVGEGEQFVLVKNSETGGYVLESVVAGEGGYLTVGDDGDDDTVADDIILSYQSDPATQEWLIVGDENNSFKIILRANMQQYLTIVSYGTYNGYYQSWIETSTDLMMVETTPSSGFYRVTSQQQWKIYENGTQIQSNNVNGGLETETYYVNNLYSADFAKWHTSQGVSMLEGSVYEFGDSVQWIITNVGNNEYTIQPYGAPSYFLRCDSSNGVRFRQSSGTADYLIWIIQEDDLQRGFFTIKNKSTGRYLYDSSDGVYTDENATNLTSHRWRFIVKDEYIEVTPHNVDFHDVRIAIGDSADIQVSTLADLPLVDVIYDFRYLDISGAATPIVTIDNLGIHGLRKGTAVYEVVHRVTGVEFQFSVEVYDPFEGVYFIKNGSGHGYVQDDDSVFVNVRVGSFFGNNGQAWRIIYHENDRYMIQNLDTMQYLTVGTAPPTRAEIIQLPLIEPISNTQIWSFTELENGLYKIHSESWDISDTCVSLDGYYLTSDTYTNDWEYDDEWELILPTKTIQGVPTNLGSGGSHLCIPCAITNVAGYWSNNGYEGFDCATAAKQEAWAEVVQQTMIDAEGEGAHEANDNILIGALIFSHTDEDGDIYRITAEGTWRGESTESSMIATIVREINAGRPLLLGYTGQDATYGYPDCPYVQGHMTVCAGYEFINGVWYVYVSDAHEHDDTETDINGYIRHELKLNTYNDFICTMHVEEYPF